MKLVAILTVYAVLAFLWPSSAAVYADTNPGTIENCLVTAGMYAADKQGNLFFRYGGEVLSVQLYVDGWWHGFGPERSYRNKLWWFSEGYKGLTDPVPFLTVVGQRLDQEDEPANVKSVSQVVESVESAMDGTGDWSMLALIEFPSAGCWEVTGEYGGQILTFVDFVGENEHIYESDAK